MFEKDYDDILGTYAYHDHHAYPGAFALDSQIAVKKHA